MSQTIKAIKATIKLGNTDLDVFQLPNGEYAWAAKHITDAIQIRHSRVAQISATKQAQSLIGQGLEVADFSPKKLIFDGGRASGYSTEIAFFVWQYEAIKGNELAQSLVFACGAESLERRADAAFNIKRSEEERNQRFVSRRDGILSRSFWTDCIDTYLQTNSVSKHYKKYIYSLVSDQVNKAILGSTAKEYRESLGLPKGISTRDYLTTEQLKQIDTIEKAAGMRVTKNNVDPNQAIKDVIGLIC